MYDQAFLDQQKQKLLSEKQKLTRQVEQFAAKDKHVKGDYDAKFEQAGDDLEDNAFEVSQYENASSLETTYDDLLKKIDVALTSIENGSYGQCQDCPNGMIPKERLETIPWADTCVDHS